MATYSALEREVFGQYSRPTAGRFVREQAGRILEKLIFFALPALLALTAIPYGTVESWSIAIFECLVFVLAALWFIEGWLNESWQVEGRALLVPLLALIVFAFLQSYPFGNGNAGEALIEGGSGKTISADSLETRRFAVKLLALVLVGQMLLRYVSTLKRLRALVYTIVGIGVVCACFGIMRQTLQRDTLGFVLPFLEPKAGYGQFINKNHFAFLMEMTLGLALGLIAGGGVRRDLIFVHLAATVPMWAALILANSRGGIMSVLSQMLFLAFMFTVEKSAHSRVAEQRGAAVWLRRFGRLFMVRAALIVGVLVLVVVSIVWIGSDPVVSNLGAASRDFSEQGPRWNVSRRDMWVATWQLFKESPIAGTGFGGYWLAVTKHHDASGYYVPQQAHNDYLELLASGGLIGLALVLWFVTAFVRRARMSLQAADPFRRASVLGALVGIFGVAVHSFFDFGLHITINALVLTALVAVVAMCCPLRETARSGEAAEVN